MAEGVLWVGLALEAPLMVNVENRQASDGTTLPPGGAPASTKNQAADLYWLAYLLTGRHDVSIDIASDAATSQDDKSGFFGGWIRDWSRRLVVAKALAAIHEELKESARRTEEADMPKAGAPPGNWSLGPDTTKSEIEGALLAIDVFSRAALLLTVFESVRIPDAATMLEVDDSLVKKGRAIGLREFTANLARKNPKAASGRALG
jgi:DNA-directed RNA polymerase specialized sigma24 family protein